MMIMILAVSVSFAPKNFFGLRLNLIINTLSCLNTDILANDIMIICSVKKNVYKWDNIARNRSKLYSEVNGVISHLISGRVREQG